MLFGDLDVKWPTCSYHRIPIRSYLPSLCMCVGLSQRMSHPVGMSTSRFLFSLEISRWDSSVEWEFQRDLLHHANQVVAQNCRKRHSEFEFHLQRAWQLFALLFTSNLESIFFIKWCRWFQSQETHFGRSRLDVPCHQGLDNRSSNPLMSIF